jgi:hypothetical protein
MAIKFGLVFVCLVSGITWALTQNPNLKSFSGMVFTASLAAIFVEGPRWML